jgi:preprotein translocase subunit YajC
MGDIGSFLPLLLIFAVVYFFMIRPQMKRQKQEQNFITNLKKGDKVVTKSGLHGKVLDFSDKLNAVIIESGAGKLTFDKSAISHELTAKLNAPPKEEKEKK